MALLRRTEDPQNENATLPAGWTQDVALLFVLQLGALTAHAAEATTAARCRCQHRRTGYPARCDSRTERHCAR